MHETESSFESAKASIERIFNILNIQKVVFVDDIFPDTPSIEEILGTVLHIDEKNVLIDCFPELGNNIPSDEDILAQKLRSIWADLNQDDRLARAEKLPSNQSSEKGKNIDDDEDYEAITTLKTLIPGLITLSLNQWNENRSVFLNENQPDQILFLFDQDLSKNGGTNEEGIKIIQSIIDSNNSEGKYICGLLTSTVEPNSQADAWQQLSSKYNIPKDLFQVIPKNFINDEPSYFGYLIKAVALSPEFSKLKNEACSVMEEATRAAEKQLHDISIFDLDQIVFQISKKEGLWEPDMLFRLHSIFHRIESRILAGRRREDFESLSRKIRAVSEIDIDTDFRPFSSAREIQKKELYVPATFLNNNFLPLELGDIFEKTNKGSINKHILLAQPCDLMVRNDGKRNAIHVPIAEVVCREKTSDFIPKNSWIELEYFDESPDKIWYIKLESIHYIDIDVLDLCSFNPDGMAKFHSNNNQYSSLQPSRQNRYEKLKNKYESLLSNLEILIKKKGEDPEIGNKKTAIAKVLIGGDPFGGIRSGEKEITYKCRRIARLANDRAYAMLINHAGLLSRPAFDRNLV